MSTITTLKWRILDASDNRLTLISDTTANTGFTLQGADGYNNGVLLLNNACKAMYSNSGLGAIGRSINIEDIEDVSSYEVSNKETVSIPSYRNYPNIYALEKTGSAKWNIWNKI